MKMISSDIRQIIEYRDQIMSGLFKIYKTITSQHIDVDIHQIIRLQITLDNEIKRLLSDLRKE